MAVFSFCSGESSIDLSSTFAVSQQLMKLLFSCVTSSASSFKTLTNIFSFLCTKGMFGERTGELTFFSQIKKWKQQTFISWVAYGMQGRPSSETFLGWGVCCARPGFADFRIPDFCWGVRNAQTILTDWPKGGKVWSQIRGIMCTREIELTRQSILDNYKASREIRHILSREWQVLKKTYVLLHFLDVWSNITAWIHLCHGYFDFLWEKGYLCQHRIWYLNMGGICCLGKLTRKAISLGLRYG